MPIKSITSAQNPLIKHLVNLRKERTYREGEKKLLISGKKMVGEYKGPIELLIVSDAEINIKSQETLLVPPTLLSRITGLEEPDGVAAVIAMPKEADLSQARALLIADGIGDPGNLGTLIRSAYAFGWDGIVLTPNTVDIFNDKTLRAAKGANLSFPFSRKSFSEMDPWLLEKEVYLADLKGEPLASTLFRPPFALILSSEGKGASGDARKRGKKIAIPMRNSVESLNVAQAGAIFLYTMGLCL